MKKLLAIITSLAVVLAMMPSMAFADTCANGASCTIHEAKIGDVHYETLDNAVESVTTGQTIVLLCDITLKKSLTISGKDITLDTNGKTITNSNAKNGTRGIVISSGARLVLTGNGTFISGEGNSTGDNSSLLDVNGTLDVNGLSLRSANTCIGTHSGVVNILNATMTALDGGCCGYAEGKGIINVYGVTFGCEGNDPDGPGSFWAENGGTVNIYGGTFKAAPLNNITHEAEQDKANYCLFDYHNSETHGYEQGNISVYGGTFIDFNPGNVDQTGVNHSYLAEGFATVNNEGNNTWSVIDNREAQIDDTKYVTLADAIDAAGENATIELLKNTSENITIPSGKKITIDLKGKKMTDNGTVQSSEKTDGANAFNYDNGVVQVATVKNYGNVHITDSIGGGTIDSITNGIPAILNYYGGNCTLEKIIVERSEETGTDANASGSNSYYTVLNYGTMKIEKGTEINNKGKYSSNLVNRVATDDKPSKLIINGGRIDGGLNSVKNEYVAVLEIKDGEFINTAQEVIRNSSKATISGGTFTCEQDNSSQSALYSKCDYNGKYYYPAEVQISGGIFNGKIINHQNYDTPEPNGRVGASIDISGGIFNDELVSLSEFETTETYYTITGGTFSSNPEAYVADNFGIYKYASGKYTVAATAPANTSSYHYWSQTINDDGVFPEYYAPPAPADPITNDGGNAAAGTVPSTTVDTKPVTTTTGGVKTTTGAVDTATGDKLVEKAVANKSEEVVVDVTTSNANASSAAGAKTEVTLPEATVQALAEQTDASVDIRTDNASVTLDNEAVKEVAKQAGTTGEVKLVVETVKSDAKEVRIEVKLETSNGTVTNFGIGNVRVTVPVDQFKNKNVVCVYIDDNGNYTKMEGMLNADGTYTFVTNHFSTYAIMEEAEADKVIAEQNAAKLNDLIKEVKFKASTKYTSKKNVKVTAKVLEGDIDAITDMGYTVKYKFYRAEKKSSRYALKATKTTDTYTNTAGKKGKKYYYKVRLAVYDGDTLVGETELKQSEYGVRTWKK